MQANIFEERLMSGTASFHPVVSFTAADRFLQMDFTSANTELTAEILNNTQKFEHYINQKLQTAGARYGIGGYNEHRTIYSRSELFGSPSPTTLFQVQEGAKAPSRWEKDEEPSTEEQQTVKSSTSNPSALPAGGGQVAAQPAIRRLHLGTDIWGPVFTPVLAPLNGIVHSYAFNDAYGDYGATIILQHQAEGFTFHTLYGHLSLNSLNKLKQGAEIKRGTPFAQFGAPQENGHWPPHLHFQIIKDMQGMVGDYPGVCAFNEREAYLANCPNPEIILRIKTSGATLLPY